MLAATEYRSDVVTRADEMGQVDASKQAAGERAARPAASVAPARAAEPSRASDPFVRAENEDDDGYDPYSDRRPDPEPLFERDPWS